MSAVLRSVDVAVGKFYINLYGRMGVAHHTIFRRDVCVVAIEKTYYLISVNQGNRSCDYELFMLHTILL